MQIPIPNPDPMPLPGPVWLFRTLLLLTFFLHVVVMNFSLGGGFIALVSSWQSKRDEHSARLAAQLRSMLPALVAFTITLGVAALLFVQVLYGQLLYASSVLIGIPWMAVIPLLIIGYYAFYWSSLRKSTSAMLLAVVILVMIAFTFSNNMTLMLTPDRWLNFYHASMAGMHFNLGDSSLIPRYLHMVLGAFALGGLLLVILGLRESDSAHKQWLLRNGGIWFAGATMLNVLVGFWFLVALPAQIMKSLIGTPFTAAFLGISVLLTIVAMVCLLLAANPVKGTRPAIIGIASGLLTVALMIVVRDRLRTE
ncbi:MAG TPA: hypothetical protein VG897_10095, partial [Terriglobales bacterium]|nr:hypothetical protein [Terriglobales bacterium]